MNNDTDDLRTLLARVRVLPILALTLALTGCDLVGDILEFGFWVGVIVIVLIVAVIWLIVRKVGGGSRRPPPPA